MRAVFILGKVSLISAACKDAGFEQRHPGSSVGVELSLSNTKSSEGLGTTPLQPVILMKIYYFVSLLESVTLHLSLLLKQTSKMNSLLPWERCCSYFPTGVAPAATRNILYLLFTEHWVYVKQNNWGCLFTPLGGVWCELQCLAGVKMHHRYLKRFPQDSCVYTVSAGCRIIPLRCFHKHQRFFTFFELWDYANPRSCG